jgi:uncharacterized surface protein with fasciclin (FAS1) repeats
MWSTIRQALAVLVLTAAGASGAAAQASDQGDMAMDDRTTMVGGQAMFRTRNIVDNAVNSADHTTLVAAVKATNAAFATLPEGTVPTLLKPENRQQLTKVLTYHVVAGRYDAPALMELIRKGGGKASLTTASGGQLWVMMNGDRNVVVRDAKGGVASISTYDVVQSNGVIHVVDKVLLPS